MRHLLIPVSLVLAACGSDAPPPEVPAPPPMPPAYVELLGNPARAKLDAAIDASDLARHIQTLSSDEYEGRGPGSLGERLTLNFFENEFQRIGFLPAVADGKPCAAFPCEGASFFQRVPMVTTRTAAGTTLSLAVGGQEQVLTLGKEMVVGSRVEKPRIELKDSDVVFVGYGVNAPEQNWNDYAGLDVKGKTVVMLINDPGFLRGDQTLFKGRAMTYYGRWTYKFEEAARQGAKAAFIVHNTEPAAYGWDVVVNSWTGPQHDLPIAEDPEPRIDVQGWITLDAAKALFAADGKDFDALMLAADAPGFKPVALNAKASASIAISMENAFSHNAVAILPGTSKPDESVLYMGHWDHLGVNDQIEGEDHILNGAIDNASGVAGALEIAHAFAAMDPKPERSIVIMLPTLEESGLLGSKYFAAHPPLSLTKMAAVINMDALPIRGRNLDMGVIGQGQSPDLEALLAGALQAQGRRTEPEAAPEKGFFFRSDHFNFAKQGVPALYARAGLTHVARGAEYGKQWSDEYTANRYHKPADQFDPAWDYAGVVEDLSVYFEVGKVLSAAGQWPEWGEASEFRAARAASASERAP
ncbi:MAG: M28 family peptidase [Xanthomonadales bacterium]|nr:M28 family peptidase [Xanthomonadales bacterium]